MAEVFEIAKAIKTAELADRVEALNHQIQELRESATGALVSQIEANPLRAIAVAAGVGYLASLLIGLSLAPRPSRPRVTRAAAARRRRRTA